MAPTPNGGADPWRKLQAPPCNIRFQRLKKEVHPKLKFHTFTEIGWATGEISEM